MPEISVLDEKLLQIKEIDPEILALKSKSAPAIMDFGEDRWIKGDWHFKFTKAFETPFNIRKSVGKNQGLKYQSANFTLNRGDTFETFGRDNWKTFCADPRSRSIEVHFSNGQIIRFWLFKPTADGKRVEKVGLYRCTNLEFLQILKYGIDQYIN